MKWNVTGGGFSRKGLNFKKDTQFAGITSDNADYYKNVWDKGHLAPAADFNCDYEKLEATFNYLNCALQHNKLNRKEWKELEEQVRAWAKDYGDLGVRVELHFEKNHLILPTGAHVPSAFTKIILIIKFRFIDFLIMLVCTELSGRSIYLRILT